MSDSIKKWHGLQEQSHRAYPGDVFIHESPDGGKTVNSRPFREPKQDSFVQKVKGKFEERSQTGIEKYGTTLEREDIDLKGWLTHLQEELMDATLYVEKLLHETTNNSKTNT